MKVLLFAHSDPPIHGQAVAAMTLVEQSASWGDIVLYHINTVFSEARTDLSEFTFGKVFRGFRYLFRAVALVRREKIDAIIVTPSFLYGPFLKDSGTLFVLSLLTRATIVGWVHMDPSRIGYSGRSLCYRWYVRSALKRVDRWVPCAPGLVRTWPAIIPEEKCYGIANGINVRYAAIRRTVKHRWRVVYLSAIDDQKGWRELLDVARDICMKHDDVEFNFYGEASAGNTEANVRSTFEAVECAERILWHGPVYDMEKAQALKDGDLFCLPSHTEQFPLVLLEAMAAGLPVVATDVGAVRDALEPGAGGWIVPAQDRSALKTALTEAIGNRAKCMAMGEHNREVYDARFTGRAFGENWEHFLQGLSLPQPTAQRRFIAEPIGEQHGTGNGALRPVSPLKVRVYAADQHPKSGRSLGISRMTEVVIDSLGNNAKIELSVVSSRSSLQFKTPVSSSIVLPWSTRGMLLRMIADHLHPVCALGHGRADLWYFPKGFLPRFHKLCAPSVVTIHDTIIQHCCDHYPKWRSRTEYRYWAAVLRHTLRHADVILTVSESARGQIMVFMQRHRLPEKDIQVIYEPCIYESLPQPELAVKSGYVLHLGSREPHKRTGWLIRQWADACSANPQLPHLHVVGSVPIEVKELAAVMPNIVELPLLDDVALQAQFTNARALILPSEIEGFGLPALEAYYLGTPVCFVKGTSVEEILGVATSKGGFSLTSADSLFSALEEVMGMSAEEVRECGLKLRASYAAEKVAERMVAVFEKLRKCNDGG